VALETCILEEQGRERQKEARPTPGARYLAGAAVLDEAEQRPEYKAALLSRSIVFSPAR
jgi:hypothetical protein